MLYYRLYFRGPRGFAGFEDFEAHDDEAAFAIVHSLERGLDMELWNEGRFVGPIPA